MKKYLFIGIFILISSLAWSQNGLWGAKSENAEQIANSTLVVILDDNPNEPYNRVVRPVFENEWDVCRVIFVPTASMSGVIPQKQYTLFRPILTASGRTGLGIFPGDGNFEELYVKDALAMCIVSRTARAEETFDYWRPLILLMQEVIRFGLDHPGNKRLKIKKFNDHLKKKEIVVGQKRVIVPRHIIYNEKKFYKRLGKVYPGRVDLVAEPLIRKAIREKDPTSIFVKPIPNDLYGFFDTATGECIYVAEDKDFFGLQPDFFKGLL